MFVRVVGRNCAAAARLHRNLLPQMIAAIYEKDYAIFQFANKFGCRTAESNYTFICSLILFAVAGILFNPTCVREKKVKCSSHLLANCKNLHKMSSRPIFCQLSLASFILWRNDFCLDFFQHDFCLYFFFSHESLPWLQIFIGAKSNGSRGKKTRFHQKTVKRNKAQFHCGTSHANVMQIRKHVNNKFRK